MTGPLFGPLLGACWRNAGLLLSGVAVLLPGIAEVGEVLIFSMIE